MYNDSDFTSKEVTKTKQELSPNFTFVMETKKEGFMEKLVKLPLKYAKKEKYNQAIEFYQKSLAIDMELYGREHPNIAISYNNIGEVYHNKREYNKAIDYYQQSLIISKKFLPSTHPSIQTVEENLAFAISSKEMLTQ